MGKLVGWEVGDGWVGRLVMGKLVGWKTGRLVLGKLMV
jgi:hypothetical protein